MMKYYYDLHIHSCLSPCADDDMTPSNIAGMAKLNGLGILAITDHNTTKNARAFYKACQDMGIVPIAGVELTTAEDIHLVGLFRNLESAEAFDTFLQDKRILYKNPIDIYGHQLIYNEQDEMVGEDPYLLSNALMLSIDEAIDALRAFGAVVYPAHIDREANGIVSVLGTVPTDYNFSVVEIHDPSKTEQYLAKCEPLKPFVVYASDAHFLWDIQDAIHCFVFDNGLNSDQIREQVLSTLEGKT